MRQIDDDELMVTEALELGYEAGLKDAWECARKILFDDSLPRDILTDLGVDTFCGIIQDYSASEAIAKLKEYEAKQTDFLPKYEGKWVVDERRTK